MKEMMRLYKILKLHIPDEWKTLSPVEFIGTIMHNMIETGRYKDYSKAMEVLTGKPFSELMDKNTPEKLSSIFIEKVIEYGFPEFLFFCDRLGI